MPIDNEADQMDFEARLGTYGLAPSNLQSELLSTVPGAKTTMSMATGVNSRFSPIVLKTSKFEEAARWLGVPDEARVPVAPVRMPRLAGLDMNRMMSESATREALSKVSRSDLSSEQLSQVRTMARAYLRGDSRELSAITPWLELVFPVISVPIWAFQEITVTSGSVLEFGPGPNVLVAHSLTIEEGGIVRSYGDLKVDVTILRKSNPIHWVALDEALLNFTGALSRHG